MSRTTAIIWLTLAVVLASVNLGIVQKEQLIANGKPLYLELAPVDPRSLIQGDYMQLRYAITSVVDRDNQPRAGTLVVRRDERGVATFVRPHDAQQMLGANEILLRTHQENGQTYIGAESFFFQEGDAAVYETARYGELRVNRTGESVLVGLRDANFNLLQPPVDNETLPPSRRN